MNRNEGDFLDQSHQHSNILCKEK